MIWLILVFALMILYESFFCYLMKRKTMDITHNSIGFLANTKNDRVVYNRSVIRGAIGKLAGYSNDFTFLVFKIIGYIPIHAVRMFFYRYVFHVDIGRNVVIYFGLEARSPWNIRIGDGSIIGDRAILDARFGITIGRNVNLSTGVWIWTQQHDVNSPTFSTEGKSGRVVIKDRAWISSRASILPDTIIEEGCVIAAHAVVTKPVTETYAIYGGVPAKKISARSREITYEFNGNHRYFL